MNKGSYRAEPYRATRLWLESVAIFRKGVPLGKHRKQWKSYEDCFVAQDAILWFTQQLQDKFDPSITRSQGLQLLQKFYKAGIFTEASNRSSSNTKSPARETDFKDNGSLYVLTGYNVTSDTETKKITRASKSPRAISSNNLPKSTSKYSVVINPLSIEQISQVWRDVFLKRFVEIVGCEIIHTFPNPEVIRGSFVSHNLTQLGKYGVVLIGDTNDEIPVWLLSAMKCLSGWPNYNSINQGELSHVNYPGFENDVFKLIADYFNTYKGTPLLTFDLYDAFITTFIRAELFDFNSRLYSAKTNNGRAQRLSVNTPSNFRNFAIEDNYPFNASDSVGNLLMDILTPAASRGVSRQSRLKKNIVPKKILLGVNTNPSGEDSVDSSVMVKVPPMTPKTYGINRYINPFFYETAFTGGGSPVTRVVSQTELKSTLNSLPRKVRIGPTSSPACFAYENPNLELSASDMINHPKYSRVLPLSRNESSYSFYNYSTSTEQSSSSSDGTFMKGPPHRSSSAANLSDGVKDRSPYAHSKEFVRNKGHIDYANSPSKSARRTLDFYYGADACVPGLMTTEGKRMAVASFRLLTLLLPPANRRHLQLLLRCMSRVSKNEKLMLDVAMTTRAIVINTFFRNILLSADPDEFDELLALRIITFMMDNDTDIFALDQEEDIVRQAKEIISDQQIPAESSPKKKKKGGKLEDKENVQFCSRISLDEFDDQRLLAPGGTAEHLRSLMDNIMASTTLSDKEKKKRLKDFRNTYPHIYNEKLDGSEADFFNETRKSKEVKKERNPFKILKFRF